MVNPNKIILKDYIENIYKFLGDKYCFVSGAFVIEDTNDRLYDILKKCIDVNLSDTFTKVSNNLQMPIPARLRDVIKPLTETHAKYLSKDMYETHMLGGYKVMLNCKCDEDMKRDTAEAEPTAEEKKYIEAVIDEADVNYELEDEEEDILVGGSNITRPVRNIKWYPFTEKDINETDINFIYFKLEDYPTFTVGHFMDAFKRYGKGKAPTCIKSRREDCELDRARCRFNKEYYENVFESPTSVIIEGKKHDIIETYTRQGDEFFIPAVLNDYLLENILNHKNILRFKHSDDTVTISLGSRHMTVRNEKKQKQSMYQTEVGGRRSRRTHKNKKYKKRTHKKRSKHKRSKHTKKKRFVKLK